MFLMTEEGHIYDDYLPDVFGEARKALTRQSVTMSEDELQERVDTALHEAAHLFAAGRRHASVQEVCLPSPSMARQTGVCGGVHSAERWSRDAAFVHLVGYAWEELHGDVTRARNDWAAGQQEARDADVPFDDLLAEARDFARRADRSIRWVAMDILAALPKHGVIKGAKLRRIYGPVVELAQEPAAYLP